MRSKLKMITTAAMISVTSLIAADNTERTAKNTVFGELMGAGGVYSFNYERLVENNVGVRVGFSRLSMSAGISDEQGSVESKVSMTTIPVTASYLGISKGKHALELGGGMAMMFASGSVTDGSLTASGSGFAPIPIVITGYRLAKRDGGFNFRLGVEGKFNFSASEVEGAKVFLPWGYLSLGGTFGNSKKKNNS